jgi:hypothetical protein
MKSNLLLLVFIISCLQAGARTNKGIRWNASVQPEIISVKDVEKPDYHSMLYGMGAGVNLSTHYFQSSLHLGIGTASTSYDKNGVRNQYVSHSGNEVTDMRRETGNYIYTELAGVGSIDVCEKLSFVGGLKGRLDISTGANTEGLFLGLGPTAGVQYHFNHRLSVKAAASYLHSLSVTRGWQGTVSIEF